jgi:hypothetical protein
MPLSRLGRCGDASPNYISLFVSEKASRDASQSSLNSRTGIDTPKYRGKGKSLPEYAIALSAPGA